MVLNIMYNNTLQEFLNVYKTISSWEEYALPLCAAENTTSQFTRLPKTTFLQEKYILGGTLQYSPINNFIGSENLYDIYALLQNQCSRMFGCRYSDARTLSGLNAIITILMSLFDIGDSIMISSPEYGGHTSMPIICERLGLNVLYLPYDYANKDFNYDEINNTLNSCKIKGILIALSDMIEQPQLFRLKIKDEIILYDATQILGLIATGYTENPFTWFSNNVNFVLLGATHKTIPGPTSGLIMTNNLDLAKKFDIKINPDYLRNVQLDNVVSLLFSLLELECFGKEYFGVMKRLINTVAQDLNENKIEIIKTRDSVYSRTHQLWLFINSIDLDVFEQNAILSGVSLNVRKRRIYNYKGVRLGFQQIARYNWNEKDAHIISKIILYLCNEACVHDYIRELLNELAPKKVHFTFDNVMLKKVFDVLHNGNMEQLYPFGT